MAPADNEPMKVAQTDADIIWLFDMLAELGVHQHDSAHSSILLHGDYLYINTSNGVDKTHRTIRRPDAPSLIVLEKATGRLLAQDAEHIGPRIFHCTWSSPALALVAGKRQIIFCGGDGVVYAFSPLKDLPPHGTVQSLERIWRYDCDPTAPKENVHNYIRNRKESPSNIKGMPVFHKNRIYVAAGGDIWWGKNEAWLHCIDATKTGDTTHTARLWSAPLSRHCCSTPAITAGLAFITDCGGHVHCIDADTGVSYWDHDTRGQMWASPLVADGKVYVGTQQREFWVFAATKEKKILSTVKLESHINGTPMAANGVVYVPTMTKLYAISQ